MKDKAPEPNEDMGMTTKELKRLNSFRKSVGLPPIVQKDINCLNCNRVFKSFNVKKNRICYRCRVNQENIDNLPVHTKI